VNPDGTIRLTPIWFLFESGCFYFQSSSTSRKVKKFEESPSASVVVDARKPGRELWVSASEPVEIRAGLFPDFERHFRSHLQASA
jgi:general stress protein 26